MCGLGWVSWPETQVLQGCGVERMNMDDPPHTHTYTQFLACNKSSTFSLFFPFFLPSVSRSFPASLFPSASSTDPLLLSLSGFSSGNRRLNSSFQDTDILSCLFSSLQSCFPIQVVSCWKIGPSQELLAATDRLRTIPSLAGSWREQFVWACAGSIHTLRLDWSPKSLPTQLCLPRDGETPF